jgi:hypothetical protein
VAVNNSKSVWCKIVIADLLGEGSKPTLMSLLGLCDDSQGSLAASGPAGHQLAVVRLAFLLFYRETGPAFWPSSFALPLGAPCRRCSRSFLGGLLLVVGGEEG